MKLTFLNDKKEEKIDRVTDVVGGIGEWNLEYSIKYQRGFIKDARKIEFEGKNNPRALRR